MPDSATHDEAFLPAHLGLLDDHIPTEAVDEILTATNRTQKRIRLLPARTVVYFVLACALWPHRGYRRVFSALAQGPGRSGALPSAAALRQARTRLGPAPLRALLEWICRPLAAPRTHEAWFHRLRLVAWDGTDLDTAACAQPDRRPDRAYAKITLLALIECGTRALIGATWAPGHAGERRLAADLLGHLRPDMLLLADRGYYSADMWQAVAATGAQTLWRVNATLALPVHRLLDDRSYLSTVAPAGRPTRTVRVIEARVVVTAEDGTRRTERYRLVTSLLDPDRAPAGELVALYARRWEIETAYYTLKVLLPGGRRPLRSRTPVGCDQEVAAQLVLYQALRSAACEAADRLGAPARRVSFTAVLDAVEATVLHPVRVGEGLFEGLLSDLLPRRRARSYPRTRLNHATRFPRKKRGCDPGVDHPTVAVEVPV
ncbi:IS4 family transposase, partial [Streptomonospora sediminis]